jgi:hypothetical protein
MERVGTRSSLRNSFALRLTGRCTTTHELSNGDSSGTILEVVMVREADRHGERAGMMDFGGGNVYGTSA